VYFGAVAGSIFTRVAVAALATFVVAATYHIPLDDILLAVFTIISLRVVAYTHFVFGFVKMKLLWVGLCRIPKKGLSYSTLAPLLHVQRGN
jgi:site-specific recombinase